MPFVAWPWLPAIAKQWYPRGPFVSGTFLLTTRAASPLSLTTQDFADVQVQRVPRKGRPTRLGVPVVQRRPQRRQQRRHTEVVREAGQVAGEEAEVDGCRAT